MSIVNMSMIEGKETFGLLKYQKRCSQMDLSNRILIGRVDCQANVFWKESEETEDLVPAVY
jgi:hypothetical protein